MNTYYYCIDYLMKVVRIIFLGKLCLKINFKYRNHCTIYQYRDEKHDCKEMCNYT